MKRDTPFLGQAVVWLMALGALSSLAATGSGWILALHEHVRSDERVTLEWHRWLGISTAAMACIAWISAARWRDATDPLVRWGRHGIIWSAVALVTLAGHLGAIIVWGKDWFS